MGIFLKVLIFVAAVIAVMYWWRSFIGARRGEQSLQNRDGYNPSQVSSGTQTVTCCKHCGIFTPEKDVVYGRLGGYCSQKHRELDEKAMKTK